MFLFHSQLRHFSLRSEQKRVQRVPTAPWNARFGFSLKKALGIFLKAFSGCAKHLALGALEAATEWRRGGTWCGIWWQWHLARGIGHGNNWENKLHSCRGPGRKKDEPGMLYVPSTVVEGEGLRAPCLEQWFSTPTAHPNYLATF